MAKCPDCGKELSAPKKKIENHMFRLAYYKCDNCGNSFTVSF
jgi:transposase-like protein